MNGPLGELDAAIDLVSIAGSGTATTLTAQANAGQASLTVASSAGFLAGDPIYIGTGVTFEARIIATVPNATTIVVTVNLSNTYAIGKPVSKSPVEIVDARGGYTSLGGRLTAVEGRVYDAKKYGALGNGTNDDTAAIQAAIDAAAVAGGIVYLPPGVYLAGTITLKSKVHIVGAGYEATRVKLKAGTNASLFRGQDFATLTGTNGLGGINQWSMSALTIDGNRSNNTAGSGIQVYSFGYTLRDLRIFECDDDGIYSEWSTDPNSPGFDSMEAHVENVKVHDCDGNGITWAGPHDSNWIGVFVYGVSGHGVHVKPGGMLRAVLCHVYATDGIPWYLDENAELTNCIGEGAGTVATNPQVLIGANSCQILGGEFSGPDVGKRGIQIGTATFGASLALVDTLIRDVTDAIYVVNDGGNNSVRAQVFSFTNLLAGASPATDTRYELRTSTNRGPGVTTPAMPASLTAIRNTTGVDVTAYISGGTVTNIFINGVNLANVTSGAVRLPAYQEISINYSSAPIWKWVGG